MEPVTHALTSIALSRAGFNKVTRLATPMLLVSGLAADVDWATRFGGAAAFLRGYHTGTHSLLGTVAIVVGISTAFWLAGRNNPKMAVRLAPALVICTAGAGMHILLDLLNAYGVKLLWPFRQDWFAWDITASADGWILLFLLCGLLLPELFGLILSEIGSRPKRRSYQRGAIASLTMVALFITGRAFAHQRAVSLLDSREYRAQTPLAVAALPRPLNPLLWEGVAETDNAVINLEIPLGPGQPFDHAADVHFKPEPSETLNNATSSAAATEFLNYARFPLASVQPEGDGHVVRIRDMRFATEVSGNQRVVASIHLNAQNLVVKEGMEFDNGISP